MVVVPGQIFGPIPTFVGRSIGSMVQVELNEPHMPHQGRIAQGCDSKHRRAFAGHGVAVFPAEERCGETSPPALPQEPACHHRALVHVCTVIQQEFGGVNRMAVASRKQGHSMKRTEPCVVDVVRVASEV